MSTSDTKLIKCKPNQTKQLPIYSYNLKD